MGCFEFEEVESVECSGFDFGWKKRIDMETLELEGFCKME